MLHTDNTRLNNVTSDLVLLQIQAMAAMQDEMGPKSVTVLVTWVDGQVHFEVRAHSKRERGADSVGQGPVVVCHFLCLQSFGNGGGLTGRSYTQAGHTNSTDASMPCRHWRRRMSLIESVASLAAWPNTACTCRPSSAQSRL